MMSYGSGARSSGGRSYDNHDNDRFSSYGGDYRNKDYRSGGGYGAGNDENYYKYSSNSNNGYKGSSGSSYGYGDQQRSSYGYGQGQGQRSTGYNSGSYNGYSNGSSDTRSMSATSDHRTNVRESVERLPLVQKNFYNPTSAATNRSQADDDAFLKENEIVIRGKDVPRAIRAFDEAGFSGPVLTSIMSLGYDKPTYIQSVGWPIALSGRDLVGIARTGSGKTMAYTVPAVIHVMHQQRPQPNEGPIALILAPTRELAQQIQTVVQSIGSQLSIRNACLFGGAPKWTQLKDLQAGTEIIIATPGRLIDFLESGKTSLKRCSFVVLDEADRMLDMGFEPQIRKIFAQISPQRQTLMWSATWPTEVKALAEDFFKDYVQINVGSETLCANHNIHQIIDVVEERDKERKLKLLVEEIGHEQEKKTIIFAETKKKVDYLTRELQKQGWTAQCIHGDKSQGERDQVLQAFRENRISILVATDVAARGLDVEDIKFVVNYDYPHSSEDYIHRIGRTGRAKRTGTAYTFFTQENSKQVADLIGVLQEAKQEVHPKLLELHNNWKANGGSRFSGGGRRFRAQGGRGSFGGSYASHGSNYTAFD